jgi:hypothetical protein
VIVPLVRPGDRPRLGRLLIVATVGLLAMSMSPIAALANEGLKLTLLPIGQSGSYFDLTMTPSETRTFQVQIANDGGAALGVRTYAADVYTIIDGGFGARLRREPATGTTVWLAYPTAVFPLAVGQRTTRSFTVAVPADTGPGDYITSLVLENDQPTVGSGGIGLDQVVRQAVAVVVTVPGQRSPAVAIGAATHAVVAGRSVVRVGVSNTGNVRLKPTVGFRLTDPAVTALDDGMIQMDSFYARTSTFVEFPLHTLLAPGTYSVHLTLGDTGEILPGAGADLTFVVPSTPAPSSAPGGAQAIIDLLAGGGGAGGIVVAGGALIAAAAASFWLRRRRRQQRADDPAPLGSKTR